ncbi:unnamed protein product [Spirodela intermedia]|uniref:Uncharacterized protein n=2 Tax=Spirodela intermedia TaxID=51605 RepID=A0A7I8JAZ4_SPIIN|nr:unnamed protein product [Spirodela intermedia]CAA6666613.1 unnamed protein product [Spirodela intermedia]CAA7403411.1 unnamed protein product [Spirodela intermedia]
MKLTVIFLHLSSLFLLVSSTDGAPAVLDIEGNEVRRGITYYVLPNNGTGGGLTASGRNATCPLYVGKASSETDPGVALIFFPLEQSSDALSEASDTNIAFSSSPLCAQSMVWKLQGGVSEGASRVYVGLDGTLGNPGVATVSNWFNVRKAEEGGYNLVFCPGVCEVCRVICGDLGLFVEDGKTWLGLRGSSFSVVFKKV